MLNALDRNVCEMDAAILSIYANPMGSDGTKTAGHPHLLHCADNTALYLN